MSATRTATPADIVGHRVGNTACVVLDEYVLKIGRDFADAVTGTDTARRSHGVIGVRKLGKLGGDETRTGWISALDCTSTEAVLRKAVASEGFKVTYFLSQAEG